MEKIPDSGPALIVYYHGAIPIDYYYFLANVIIQKGRTCHSVGDHFLFKIPGLLLRTPPPPTGFLLSDVLGTPESVSQGPAKSHGVFISVTVLQHSSGFKLLLEVFSVIHGPQEECVRALRSGHLLGISPGGVREALFSDETYPLLWGKRRGFAQVALDSRVVRD